MEQQAAAFLDHLEETGLGATILIRDMDSKYCKEFEKPLEDKGIEMKPVGPRAPNLNAFIERWVQSVKLEALNNFIVFGRAHFDHIVSEYLSYYHKARPHQSLENRPLTGDWPSEEKELSESDEVVCHTQLGGLLKHYERRAA
jgi:putative transposase